VKDLCLQIAAANPTYVSRDSVPEVELAKEREIASAAVAGKPAAVVQKIVEGKLEIISPPCVSSISRREAERQVDQGPPRRSDREDWREILAAGSRASSSVRKAGKILTKGA